jgi:hypothetical protein
LKGENHQIDVKRGFITSAGDARARVGEEALALRFSGCAAKNLNSFRVNRL